MTDELKPCYDGGSCRNEDLIDALRARIAELEAAARWVPVGERLPEVNEAGWSDYVQLAYKVIGCKYSGAQTVSRFHFDVELKAYVWDYLSGDILESWGYEAYAWRPLPVPPEVEG
jgi:hypothetical protein